MKIEKLIYHNFGSNNILVVAELVKVNGKLWRACKDHADVYNETEFDFRKKHSNLKIIGKRKNLQIDNNQAHYRFFKKDLL